MKTLTLLPTEENLISTYENDAIGRNFCLHKFVELLHSIEDEFALALQGKWGSGKTFFIKQAKMILDAQNPNTHNISEENKIKIERKWKEFDSEERVKKRKQVCVYYDAWKCDNDEDPILSLIYEISKELEMNYDFKEEGDILALYASMIDAFTGFNVRAVRDTIKSKESFVESIEKERKFAEKIKAFFGAVLKEGGERIVVFIDELDRCKPSYAVNLLEKIKHYFTDKSITFVFSINAEELGHTIEKYYGQGFDSNRYLDRFFDLRMDIPKLHMEKYYDYIGYNYDSAFPRQKNVAKVVVNKLGLEMREIYKYTKLLKIATHNYSDFKGYSSMDTAFAISYIAPILLGLRMHDLKKYYDFIEGRDGSFLISVLMEFEDEPVMKRLLDNGETYGLEIGNGNKTTVSLKDKLERVYKILFNKYYVYTGEENIGNMVFYNNSYKIIDHIINMFSEYTKFDV